jgi:polyphosphate kinase 2
MAKKHAKKPAEPANVPSEKPSDEHSDEHADKRSDKHPDKPSDKHPEKLSKKKKKKFFRKETARLQIELVKLQEWIKAQGLKVVVIFEGRDAAGKGGVIKCITQHLSPRICRVAALAAPTEREKTQWYFQRYVPYLPAGGEMVLFDRSWYNRAGVERVMGFCLDHDVAEFFHSCPEFERMLIRSGIVLLKYWFSVSDEEQERRFQSRIEDPTKRWKLSPMDLESRSRWVEYSKAKDEMFACCDITQAPWFVVNADNKKRARLNVISHLLSLLPYEDLTPEPIILPERQSDGGYVRPPLTDQTFVPEIY